MADERDQELAGQLLDDHQVSDQAVKEFAEFDDEQNPDKNLVPENLVSGKLVERDLLSGHAIAKLKVEELLSKLLEMAKPLAALEMPLLDCLGATLASDVYAGERLVLAGGAQIRSLHIGLAASIGIKRLPIIPHPRVVVISIGDELIEPGLDFTTESQEYEVNSWMLSVIAREAGATTFRVHAPLSDKIKIKELIEDQLVRADLLVISGEDNEASDRQLLEVLKEISEVVEVNVKMENGGTYRYLEMGPDLIPALILPSKSSSAFLGGEIFLRPMIRSLMGAKNLLRPTVKASLTKEITVDPNIRTFLPVKLMTDSKLLAEPIALGSELDLLDLSSAKGLLIVPENSKSLNAGAIFEVLLLDR
jgi:molybdopterin molybdotransferase